MEERVRSWLAELKRRRMLRAVAAYGAVVLALVLLAEGVVRRGHLPGWTVSAVAVAAAVGFPIVLVLAWFFDLTPRGLARTPPPSALATPRPDAGDVAAAVPGAMTALLEQLAFAPDVAPPPRAPLRPGDTVGRFELVREIGRGGFGVVYEARDRELGRLVALKTVRPRRGVDPSQLRAEAEAAAQLQHPNIVTVHDAGVAGGEAWIVLELLRGETLEDRLRRGPVPRDEAIAIAVDVARGLAHAHRAGVVHRDLKPANVFLCADGAVKILDFGLSRVFGSGGADGGTPAYMAPEQWRGETQDARADVFAAGVMLHEMLAGARPYGVDGGRSAALDADRASALPAKAAPLALRKLVACAIDPSPPRRPPDGAAWLEALLAVARRGARRREARTGAAIGGAGAVVAAVAVALATWRPAPKPEADGSRIAVAVADVQNGTADPELNGLSGLLVTSLEQSRRLVVLTRSRMVDAIRQLGKEPPEVLDESLAREVGRSIGVRALLLGTVHRFDDRYAIELRALDPVSNEYLFTLQEEGRGKSSVPDLIDRLARATRERLRERPGEAAGAGRPVAGLTTGSLAAYEHYFRARQAIDLRQFSKARGELEAALRIDPAFALAHLAVVVLDAWTHAAGARPEDTAHLESASRLVDRLPEKERLALLAYQATVDGRTDESVRLRDEAARLYPQDKEAVFWAGDVRFHQEDYAGALPMFERALALDPDYRLAMEHVVRALHALGRPADALAAARRWADAARDPESRRALGAALLANDRLDDAREAFREAGVEAPAELVTYLAHRGRVREAETLARSAVASRRAGAPRADDTDKLEHAQDHALQAVLLLEGRWREARDAVDARVARTDKVEGLMLRIALALGTRAAGDARAAAEALQAAGLGGQPALAAQVALALVLAHDAPPQIEAVAAPLRARAWRGVPENLRVYQEAFSDLNAGRGAEAEARVRALAARTQVGDVRIQCASVLGEWAVRRGAARDAVEWLERAVAAPWSPYDLSWLALRPRALYFLAAAHEQLGDRERARARIDELLALWSRADAEVPLLADARALRRRVAAGGQVAERHP